MPILDVDHAKTIVVIKRSMGHGRPGIDIELHTNPKTRMYFADAKQALSANHVRDQDPRRLRSTTSKTVAKNRRELKEETRWHTRPSTRTTTRQSPPSTTSPTSS
jgi:NAD(P) transhydrogenase beta subunit